MFRIEVQGLSGEIKELGKLKNQLTSLAADKKKLNAEYKYGIKTQAQYEKGLGKITIKTNAVRKSAQHLEKSINAQSIATKGAAGSMTRLGYDLGQLKTRYRNLSQAERDNMAVGGKMLTQIRAKDAQIKKLDATLGNHQRNVGNYSSATAGLKTQMLGVMGAITGVVMAGRGLINFMKDSVAKATEQERAERKVEAVLRSTGYAAGMTGQRLKDMASELQKVSTVGDEEILNKVTAQLLTFTNITSESFARTQRVVMDLSSVLDGDLKQASIMLGKALNDPITGLSSLREVGIAFTDEQITLVKELVNSNQLLEAQSLILSELERQYGGTSSALAEGSGVLKQWTNAWGDFKEYLGQTVLPTLTKVAKAATDGLIMLTGDRLEKLKTRLAFYESEEGAKYRESYKELIRDLQNEIFLLETRRKITEAELLLEKTKKSIKEGTYKVPGTGGVDKQYEARKKLGLLTTAELMADEIKAIKKTNEYALLSEEDKQKKISQIREKHQKKGSDKAQKEYENTLKIRTKAIIDNEKYIQRLRAQFLDLEIAAMSAGIEKKRAVEDNRWSDSKEKLQSETDAKIKAIDKEIQAILDKKKKATPKDLEQVDELLNQRQELHNSYNQVMTQGEEAHQAKLLEIIQKSSKKDLVEYAKTLDQKTTLYRQVQDRINAINEEGEDKITQTHNEGIRKVEAEYNVKKTALEMFYQHKGTLTVGEEKKMALEEKQLAIEVATKKYQLLQTEIEARRELGTLTEQQYQEEMRNLAELYFQIRLMQEEMTGGAEEEGDGNVTSWMVKMFELKEGEAQAILSQVEQLLNSVVDMYMQSQQQRIQNELKAERSKLNKQQKNELKQLEYRRKKGLITEEQYKAEKERIEEKYNRKRIEAEKKAFEQNKKLQKTMIWINAALAVIKSIAEYGFIIGGIMGALILITAGLQVANIDKQKYPEYAKGGRVRGRSHAQGGETFAVGGDLVELEGGEGVVNKRSMASNDILNVMGTPSQIASSINAYRGWGVPFSSGGYVPVSTPTRGVSAFVTNPANENLLAEKIGEVINDKKVFVVESDITEAQDDAKQITIESEW